MKSHCVILTIMFALVCFLNPFLFHFFYRNFSTVSAIHGSNCGDEFILLPLNGNHSECVFDSTSAGGIVSEQRVPTVNFCDCPPSNFIERCRVMQEMYRHFVDHHRCVTLHGLKGKNKNHELAQFSMCQNGSLFRCFYVSVLLSLFFALFNCTLSLTILGYISVC